MSGKTVKTNHFLLEFFFYLVSNFGLLRKGLVFMTITNAILIEVENHAII